MYTLLYLLAALILAGLAVPLARLLGAGFSAGLLGALIVTLGLVYDNGILAAGSLIGEGPLLENLNWARYVIHAFGTPLLFIYALHAARSSRAHARGRGSFLAGHSGDDRLRRSEEHTAELQSRGHLVCRLLLEKKH